MQPSGRILMQQSHNNGDHTRQTKHSCISTRETKIVLVSCFSIQQPHLKLVFLYGMLTDTFGTVVTKIFGYSSKNLQMHLRASFSVFNHFGAIAFWKHFHLLDKRLLLESTNVSCHLTPSFSANFSWSEEQNRRYSQLPKQDV